MQSNSWMWWYRWPPDLARIFFQLMDGFLQGSVSFQLFFDLCNGVDDRGMVSAAEAFADLRQGNIQKLSAKIHGYLSGESNIFRLFAALNIFHTDVIMLRHHLLDQIRCQWCGCVFTEDILQAVFRQCCGKSLGNTNGYSLRNFTCLVKKLLCENCKAPLSEEFYFGFLCRRRSFAGARQGG